MHKSLHLALLNLSTPVLSPDHVPIVALQRLATFMKRVPIDCLDVSGQDLSIANFNVLLEGFVNNTQLNDLRFSNTHSGDLAACELAAILPSTRISTLMTSANNLTVDGMTCYTKVLSTTVIDNFDVSYNFISEAGMLPFVNNLNRTKIRHLDISGNPLSFKTMDSLGQQLNALASLVISNCQLDDDYFSNWSAYIPNATISTYDLSSNALSGNSIIPLLTAQPTNRQLFLNLAKIINLSDTDFQHIGQLLAVKNISALDVSHVGLSCTALSYLLTNHSHLHTLVARNNGITDACMPVFSQYLTNQTNSLQHVDLSSNDISSVGIASLFLSLPLTQLRTLNVAGNQLTGVEFRDYPQAISHSQLTTLNLGYNTIAAEFIPYLLRTTLTNTTLQKLDLSAIDLTDTNAMLLAQLLLPPIPNPDFLADATLTRDQQRLLHDILTSSVNQTHLSTLSVSNTQIGAKGVRALCHAAPVAHLAAFDLRGNALSVNSIHQCSTSSASRIKPWSIFYISRYVYRTLKETFFPVLEMRAPVAATATLLPSLSTHSYNAPATNFIAPTLLLAAVLIKALLNLRQHRTCQQ